MTYREMAMDAGCTSEEEIANMSMMLEAQERQAWEDYWAEQEWLAIAEEELQNELNSELQMHGVD